ncbi:pyridoxamine 5'-phosphate oxidase family protein [Helicobacter aurati]|uniref:Pyridoxamine 5'-phosphate oxidase family protein n=1 Tax=Helicobacter aurati TaxID=137778 RepID=A0A3D8IWC0_9HELI|nr:pyridoxamine 5'-phosphate oxidase family protein [Helicobacter aurati]RDU69323.1 pyridoxamine 5'-phosphate oxidase family protein [Helicobacter aurati]
MRRKDRMLDRDKAIEIMTKAPYCVLSTSPLSVPDFKPNKDALYKNSDCFGSKESHFNPDNNELEPQNQIFSIPISFVYHENKLFIHTAKAGRKIAFFRDGALLCAVFVGRVQVPELYTHEELQQIAQDEPKKLGSHVFTTEYESTIAYGRIFALRDIKEQDKAMSLLCAKYMPDKMEFVQTSVNTERKHLNVYEIVLEQISAKAKVLG